MRFTLQRLNSLSVLSAICLIDDGVGSVLSGLCSHPHAMSEALEASWVPCQSMQITPNSLPSFKTCMNIIQTICYGVDLLMRTNGRRAAAAGVASQSVHGTALRLHFCWVVRCWKTAKASSCSLLNELQQHFRFPTANAACMEQICSAPSSKQCAAKVVSTYSRRPNVSQ